ncbi:hypothetical protein [Fervidibacillus halotolerans]|uniref:Uncharacterized protein n=1 Tax=Fervidibacillus halotolerans TaxID=2980027 RepID=A0A9E8LZT6_9BACI|nr:hypothetical protein [Fervidibacillus halotolerans]WAA12848.1 hypothetical protein OE105_01500 [Fervidibacillus halotolerans]
MFYVKNERGYSLLLTMFVFILFTVLTLTVMAATITGAKRNQSSEQAIQAKELAMMGVEHLAEDIYKELSEQIGENGISRTEFESILVRVLNDASIEKRTNETGTYEAEVIDIQTIPSDKNSDELKRRVTILGSGVVDGTVKQVKTTIDFGAQSTLESLKYAVGSNLSDECKDGGRCFGGEGNVYLHGGVTITGDLKVDRHLVITDRGYAFLNGRQYWIESTYPAILPTEAEETSKMVLKGNVYTFDHTPDYETLLSTSDFDNGSENNSSNNGFLCWLFPWLCQDDGQSTSDYRNVTNSLEQVFFEGNAPEIVQREPVRDEIKINETINSFKFDKNTPGVKEVTPIWDWSYNYLWNTANNYPNWSREKIYVNSSKNLYLVGENHFGSFSTNNDVVITEGYEVNKTSFENGAYIDGDLKIDDGWVELDGPIYVVGNVYINNVNAKINSIMYVKGNVVIENSVINGLNGGSLIIFADGEIDIHNISVHENEPSYIKGFFYSNDALQMFGVGSNIKIEGGVSASRIVFNAIRGRSSYYKFSGAQKHGGEYFEGKINQYNKTSRLQIIYDPEIMNTYADLKAREPMVMAVDPPQIVERETVNVE